MKPPTIGLTILAVAFVALSGCKSSLPEAPAYPQTAPLATAYPKNKNRAGLRIPGASTEFPEIAVHYVATNKSPCRLVVMPLVDRRPWYYGQMVGGTRWRACKTDALWGDTAQQLIGRALVRELSASGLFSEVSEGPALPGDITMECEIRAFCSQARGFLFVRVAGISALEVRLTQDGETIFRRTFEKVVTDADSEYTGSQVTFLEQAMRVTMADSLREALFDVFKAIESKDSPGASIKGS